MSLYVRCQMYDVRQAYVAEASVIGVSYIVHLTSYINSAFAGRPAYLHHLHTLRSRDSVPVQME